eukprot:6480276-Amphidinium_carterae.2
MSQYKPLPVSRCSWLVCAAEEKDCFKYMHSGMLYAQLVKNFPTGDKISNLTPSVDDSSPLSPGKVSGDAAMVSSFCDT